MKFFFSRSIIVYALCSLFCTVTAVSITSNLPEVVRKSLTNDVMPFLNKIEENTWSQKQKEDEFSKIGLTTATKTGMQYKSLTKKHFPVYKTIDHDSYVELNHKTILLDQTTFDDTWQKQQTATFKVAELFRGWKEALGYMKEGDIFLFYIPSRLAYGSQEVKNIPANSDMIMFVELVKLNADPDLWHQAKEFMDIDLYHPYVKVYHIFVIGAYLIFRKLSNTFMSYILGSKSKGSAPRAKGRHILFDKEDEALCAKTGKELAKDLDQFEELAKKHSKCPSGKKGGDLGWFKKGAMVPAFDKVIFNPKSELKKVYGPVETQFGYHLIVIDERELPSEGKKTK